MKETRHLNDTELFLRVKGGDDRAFRELFQKYYPKVLNIVYRFLPNRQYAEDIAQDIFLRAYRGSKRFVPTAQFSTWLYTITVNCCLSACKRLKREQALCLSEADLAGANILDSFGLIEHSPQSPETQEDQLLRDESVQALQAALAELTDEQRMALTLSEYAGLSYKEIARVSDCSAKAVERRIYHAKKKLRTLLRPYLCS